MTAALFLVLAVAGVLLAVLAAALQWPPAALSGALALAFAGLAGAAAASAVALHAPDDLTEPRERRGPTRPSPLPDDGIARPVFGRLWFAALGAFALLGLVPLIALARKPGRSSYTGWRSGVRLVDEDNVPIAGDRLADGGIETVFPQNGVDNAQAPAVLIRVGTAYFAFSKVCTHAGCPVALYRHASHQLMCPCHQSTFDVLAGAKVLSGPAPRPLPQLALGLDADGYLIARGDFDAPVGPDDWDRVT
jgi:ubiquinol-cytochrome c reductase iron-sulfur subunit